MIYEKWLIFINVANRLLKFYKNPEVDEVVDVAKISLIVTSKNNQPNEQVLVSGTDDTMVELNQSLQSGAKSHNDRVTAIRGGSGTFRKLIPHNFTPYCAYNLHLNSGGCNKYSLTNECFE